jgi:hypothetical protein
MGVDAIIALVSLLAPPAIDLVKKLFVKPGKDTPEATLSTLATTKPEVISAYILAQATLLEAQAKYFNRDVTGIPAPWVCTLRASIRPFGTLAALGILFVLGILSFSGHTFPKELETTVDGLRYTCEAVAASWFGTSKTA